MILYIDTSSNQLVTSLNSQAVVNPNALPFFAGDSGLVLQVYLLVPLQNPQPSIWNYSIIETAGLTLYAQLDNGEAGADQVIYTDQIDWSTDPNDQYFFGVFPLNTSGVVDLIGDNASASAWLRVGYFLEGSPVTVLAVQIQILPGIPTAPLVVPAPLTALSLQVANGLYVPINGGQPGQGFFLLTPNGKKIFVQAVDNPDGSTSFEASPSN